MTRNPYSLGTAQIAATSLFACALPAVALQRVSSAWSADKTAVPLGCRIPTAGVLFRSDSLLDRFPYEDIGSCLPEEGCQHQVRHPRRKKERVCIIRFTGPREASLTEITEPALPKLLREGASLPLTDCTNSTVQYPQYYSPSIT